MIKIDNLSFAFKKNEPLFKNLNMDLHPGRTYGLFGLNGAGKTTLLNHICGILFPEKGSCLIEDDEARNRHPQTMSQIYLVPEQFELPGISPSQFTGLHAPFYPRFDIRQLKEIMKQFHLHEEKKLSEQSYGQRKKFLIAFAIATNTQYLIMDEPTNGLDIPSKSQFRKIMASTNRDERCTIISTHQVRDLETMIDRVTVLHNGSIIFDQNIEDIANHLVFRKIADDESAEKIYGEEVLGGEYIISPRTSDDQASMINLELLFNGVVQSTEQINNAFKTGVTS